MHTLRNWLLMQGKEIGYDLLLSSYLHANTSPLDYPVETWKGLGMNNWHVLGGFEAQISMCGSVVEAQVII